MKKVSEQFYNIANFVSDETHMRKYDHDILEFLSENLKGLDSFFRELEKDNSDFEEERAELIIKNSFKEKK